MAGNKGKAVKNRGRERVQVGIELLPADVATVRSMIEYKCTVQAFLGRCYADAMDFLACKVPAGLIDEDKGKVWARSLSAQPKDSGAPCRIGKTGMSGHLPRKPILKVNELAARLDIKRADLAGIGLAIACAKAGKPFPATAKKSVERLAMTAPEKASAVMELFGDRNEANNG